VDWQIAELEKSSEQIKEDSDRLVNEQQRRTAELRRNVVIVADAAGKETSIALPDVVRLYDPNAMSVFAKCGHYLGKIGELLWDNPRESNTEGGLFPAIFGTVMLIFLMAVTCFPLGVLAGIYLGEYAKDGFFVRLVRIAVNNLAGIPSIVYGIFGLGFFVYGIGGLLDHWLYPELVAAGTPTFGTGGILWASLTLGLLTVPVVIVSTEEALRAIPRATREGSFALGATKFQTLVRVLVPMASPGMMTGFILAMARAAGEVAPLMITGVVKLAPQMPVDGSFPFFHLDRKFMHLGFQIYDVGFQSPNVEASKPMVFVTTLLLLLIVLVMSSLAIYLRNRMRKRYQVRTI
jgi:phosphate transport system permease protein